MFLYPEAGGDSVFALLLFSFSPNMWLSEVVSGDCESVQFTGTGGQPRLGPQGSAEGVECPGAGLRLRVSAA